MSGAVLSQEEQLTWVRSSIEPTPEQALLVKQFIEEQRIDFLNFLHQREVVDAEIVVDDILYTLDGMWMQTWQEQI